MDEAIISFIDSHRGEKHWYLPRALYPNRDTILELQRVLEWMDQIRVGRIGDLEAFQPRLDSTAVDPDRLVLRDWDQDLQMELFDRMVDSGIITPTARNQSINDRLANLRNYFNLLKKLGLAYRNKEGKLFISDAGTEFMNADEAEIGDILERQLVRLQFVNPSLQAEGYEKFQLYPYLFVLRLLRILPDNVLLQDEFLLFVAYAESGEELGLIADLASYYRSLERGEQLEILDYADKSYPDHANTRVHLGLFGATSTLGFEESELFVRNPAKLNYLIDNYRTLKYIEYERFEDWFSYIGSPEDEWEIKDIVTYYVEQGREEKARTLTEDAHLRVDLEEEEKNLRDLLEEVFSESVLEGALERNPGVIEPGLTLVEGGRQFPTDVGPIDLLCRSYRGRYVVVELKKGRASDKVIGQALRYMGWVSLYMSPTDFVEGIIVGRDISDKLRFAIRGMQHEESIVRLKEFALSADGDIREVQAPRPLS